MAREDTTVLIDLKVCGTEEISIRIRCNRILTRCLDANAIATVRTRSIGCNDLIACQIHDSDVRIDRVTLCVGHTPCQGHLAFSVDLCSGLRPSSTRRAYAMAFVVHVIRRGRCTQRERKANTNGEGGVPERRWR